MRVARNESRDSDTWTPAAVREWVRRHGGNVSALARRIGIPRTQLQALASGKQEPDAALRQRMEGVDLRADLERLAERAGLDPTKQTDRGSLVRLAQPTLSLYESGSRPVPPMLRLLVDNMLRVAEMEDRAA